MVQAFICYSYHFYTVEMQIINSKIFNTSSQTEHYAIPRIENIRNIISVYSLVCIFRHILQNTLWFFYSLLIVSIHDNYILQWLQMKTQICLFSYYFHFLYYLLLLNTTLFSFVHVSSIKELKLRYTCISITQNKQWNKNLHISYFTLTVVAYYRFIS